MPSASVETHSIETGPSTMEQIFLMAISGSAWPAREISVGLVVTPPRTPQLAASSISEMSAVSSESAMSIRIHLALKSADDGKSIPRGCRHAIPRGSHCQEGGALTPPGEDGVSCRSRDAPEPPAPRAPPRAAHRVAGTASANGNLLVFPCHP